MRNMETIFDAYPESVVGPRCREKGCVLPVCKDGLCVQHLQMMERPELFERMALTGIMLDRVRRIK